jgi:DNA-directed RNA polymerase subunit RPC12/RpoP
MFLPIVSAAYTFYLLSQISDLIKANNYKDASFLINTPFLLLSTLSTLVVPGVLAYIEKKKMESQYSINVNKSNLTSDDIFSQLTISPSIQQPHQQSLTQENIKQPTQNVPPLNVSQQSTQYTQYNNNMPFYSPNQQIPNTTKQAIQQSPQQQIMQQPLQKTQQQSLPTQQILNQNTNNIQANPPQSNIISNNKPIFQEIKQPPNKPETKLEPYICTSCRNIVYENYQYCPYCGMKLVFKKKVNN